MASSTPTDFTSLYRHGFARVAACTVRSHPADPARNAEEILAAARECHDGGAVLAVFPELCVSGYAIEDLLLQQTLHRSGERRRSRRW